MAIQPIDAQVLFSRINQLGKEQAEQKDSQTHTQFVAGSQSAKRTEEASRMVTATPEAEGENIRQLGDEEHGGGQGKNARAEKGKTEEEEEEEGGREEFVQESYLGSKIDITG